MNDISGKLGLYHNLFLDCLILALICLVLALIVFFVLDIRSTLGYLTGRRAKKKIKELEAAMPGDAKTTKSMIPLSSEPVRKASELLGKNAVEKAVNLKNTNESTAVLEAGARPRGKFLIVRELMLIHTEEVI